MRRLKIYLAYASEDRSLAAEIKYALEEIGHLVFFDRVDARAGESYHSRFRQEIETADRFVFLISPASVTKGRYPLSELELAEARWRRPGRKVVPILVKPTPRQEIPEYLKAVTILETDGNPAAAIAARFSPAVFVWNWYRLPELALAALLMVYLAGVLALKSRVTALGLRRVADVTVADYLTAGFAVCLLSLLLMASLEAATHLVRKLTGLALDRALPARVRGPALLLVATLTFAGYGIFLHDGALLSTRGDQTLVQRAILGLAPGVSVGLVLSLLTLTWVTGRWFRERRSRQAGALDLLLSGLLVSQLVLVPIYFGFFFVDRRVEVLDTAPPKAIIARSNNQYLLLTPSADTWSQSFVERSEVDGMPGFAPMRLSAFLEHVYGEPTTDHGDALLPPGSRSTRSPTHKALTAGELGAVKTLPPRAGAAPRVLDAPSDDDRDAMQSAGATTAVPVVEPSTTLLERCLEALALVLESVGSLGSDEENVGGELWSVKLDASGRPLTYTRIGSANDLSWGIASTDHSQYFALRQQRLVRVPATGEPVEFIEGSLPWKKLLGTGSDGAIYGLVGDGEALQLARMGSSRRVEELATPTRRELVLLLDENRLYRDGRGLVVERSTQDESGFEVLLAFPEGTRRLTACGVDSCGQPAMTPDQTEVTYVRRRKFQPSDP